MGTSINSPYLGNTIRTDIPALNTIVKALAKIDPSILDDLEAGTKKLVEGANGWEFQRYNGDSWETLLNFNINAQKVDGYSASTSVVANTLPVRNADGKIPGDITGNADSANRLNGTLDITAGGTGASSAQGARSALGVPPTDHSSTTAADFGSASGTKFGHSKATSTTPKALGDVAVVGNEENTFARGDHVHPITIAKGDTVGGVKLSDSVESQSSVSGGIAATPKAVNTAYQKATEALAAAENASTDAESAKPTAGTGISVSGTEVSLAPIGEANNAIGTSGTLEFGGVLKVPYETYDEYGRVTGRTSIDMTLPAKPTSVSTAGLAQKLITSAKISISASISKNGSASGATVKSTVLGSNSISKVFNGTGDIVLGFLKGTMYFGVCSGGDGGACS